MFKNFSSGRLALAGALAISALLPLSVSATPFTINNIDPKGFNCGTASPAVGPGTLVCSGPGGYDNNIQWVQGLNPQSQLSLTSLTPQTGVVSGDTVVINKLVHDNRVIPAIFNYSINIDNTIQIINEDGGAEVLNNLGSIKISFTETLNAPGCPNPTPNATVCDDFFEFDATGLAPLVFIADGLTYDVTFGLIPGVGAAFDGVIPNRVYTAEAQSSELFVTATIKARPTNVPEPMSLALLGVGLLGMVFGVRARKQ